MTRLMMFGCAAALLTAAAVYAQVAAPPAVAPAPAPAAAPATAAAPAPAEVPTAGVAPPATAWPVPAASTIGSSGTTAASSDVLVPTPPVNPWTYPAIPGSGPPFPYPAPTYSTTWPGNGQPVMVEPSTGRPVDAETVELMTNDRNLSVMINNQAASYKGLVDDDAKRAEAEKQLSKMVSEQFEIRQKLRAKQLAALEDQVKRLRKLHDERTAQRDRIVTDRVQQLLRDATGLGWGDVGGVGFEYAPFKVKMDGKPTNPQELKAKLNRRTETVKSGAPGGPLTVESTETIESNSETSTSADAK